MPEPPSPDVAENAPVDRPQALTPDAIAAVLDDFRAWLAAEATAAGGNHQVPAAAEPLLDLHTLLGQVIGLRQEVNLQTRATRAQQEQNAETLQTLGRALDTLRQAGSAPAGDEAVRPLLKALTDLHDTLALSSREVQRMEETVLPVLDQLAESEAGAAPPRRSFLARWLGASDSETEARQEQRRRAREAAGRVRQLLASLVTGYRMSVQRVDRALRQQGLEPMAVVGQTFDPERMEVVEAVADSGRPSGEVLEEVRRGYLYNGRVFRYAQVRVARG